MMKSRAPRSICSILFTRAPLRGILFEVSAEDRSDQRSARTSRDPKKSMHSLSHKELPDTVNDEIYTSAPGEG
jgi:hypothetical protein